MSDKTIEIAVVESQEKIANGIYSLWINTPTVASKAVPGQFINIYTNNQSLLLPRPISICEIDKAGGRLRLVYRVVGKGTDEFSGLKKDDKIKILGPIGNGFPLMDKKSLLVGGGIGIPPMLELAKQLNNPTIVAGYRDELFLDTELSNAGQLFVSSDNGAFGTKGNVMDAIKANNIKPEVIYACGPMIMLKALKEYAAENNIPAYISLEERIACGVGACLGCVCKTVEKDHHTHVNNTRVCTEGPVFEAKEVDI